MRAIETTKIHAARYLHGRYGVSPAWLQRRIKNDVFPQPIKLGPRTTVWRAEEIHEFIQSQ